MCTKHLKFPIYERDKITKHFNRTATTAVLVWVLFSVQQYVKQYVTMGSSTESQDNEGYADTSAFKMNEWITLLFSPTHKGAVNNNGTLPRAEVTTAVTSCSSPTLVEMPPLKKTMDWWMMTMRPRIGVFWSVVLALLALYALFMVRVYVIATQDPDGRAAQLATECKHKGQGKQGKSFTFLLALLALFTFLLLK